jgi:ThiF family
VDPDDIEVSNVSRLFGVGFKRVGAKKAKVIGSHIRKLGASRVTVITDSALKQTVLLKLRDRDVILGCVDNDRTRAVLNRFSHQYLIPVVDLGIRLDGRSGTIRATAGRVTVVGSGLTCLRCSQHLNSERIRAESLSAMERETLEREGYIMGIGAPVPAVVSLNATIAGLGVTAALNLFLGLTGGAQPVNQLYDATSGTLFTSDAVHQKGCDVCDEEQGVKGMGDGQIVSAYS